LSDVQAQYEAYPYPERDPADERKRLITGSPSHPYEMDHFLWAGRRDWSKPLRVLFAGGGTGDGLIQLAALMDQMKRPCQITYIDLSTASRAIAEERARIRGLNNITFVTGSLLDAAEHGEFDYIDCCGVLHHLPDPQAGFDALARALAPGGGMGIMVYAPYGRSGVYPLQEAFGAILADMPPAERLNAAKKIFADLPPTHPFKVNSHLVDHNQSDAGFYDLLLHSQDRAFSIRDLADALTSAGLAITAPTQQALYDLGRLAPEMGADLDDLTRMEVAEKLRGTIKTHVVYATHADRAMVARARPKDMTLIPILKGVPAAKLGRVVAQKGQVPLVEAGSKIVENLPKSAGALIERIDGRRSLSDIARMSRLDPIGFGAQWGAIDRVLGDWGLMLYAVPAGK
jgi:SAM-dependent methyltransferase